MSLLHSRGKQGNKGNNGNRGKRKTGKQRAAKLCFRLLTLNAKFFNGGN